MPSSEFKQRGRQCLLRHLVRQSNGSFSFAELCPTSTVPVARVDTCRGCHLHWNGGLEPHNDNVIRVATIRLRFPKRENCH